MINQPQDMWEYDEGHVISIVVRAFIGFQVHVSVWWNIHSLKLYVFEAISRYDYNIIMIIIMIIMMITMQTSSYIEYK